MLDVQKEGDDLRELSATTSEMEGRGGGGGGEGRRRVIVAAAIGGDDETGDLGGDSPSPPPMVDAKLELDLGDGFSLDRDLGANSSSSVDIVERRQHRDTAQDGQAGTSPTQQQRQNKGLRFPMTTRNMFMNEALGNREAAGRGGFKYEKF